MRVWVSIAIAVWALGCAGQSWVPRAVVHGEVVRASEMRSGDRGERRRWAWRGSVWGGLAWAGSGEETRAEPLPRNPGIDLPEPAPCASVALCAWERGERDRALRSLLGGGSS